ncbi:peptidylprolyl isomerase [Limosilactobacillus fastidiosus]|uniref:Peptidyl-prolyl cis-trans isomerase n=1 Tax=Limosilactobacillus fastidiosus TaxID=2759855 RepID=A0A7W3YBQ2_9LACO|nr:peptidylprolyl isomerase [Limosilactobacillus fastidiosus]MBB1063385.1 peptidylprolyl isomerase [Limosilactobacillus fastidiosus]MBB1085934.1 peptidylprolyl isomerase [Limosilactobacillus fastidiosus]MCD7084653.1 peptidylprolyl isomerase [Limosilactobacillus fastidiosus]MCD7085729.1 peptidylprolyl isomerase [Limosilactobacillus fastidiosus]MCD7113806.1 peptidylprolyl isomerase [Limosilactobacillus fastidiosus]
MQYPQLDLAAVKGPQATIKTNLGEIKIQLFKEQAPKTVKNFVQLAEKGYYDGVIFHRVIPDFMIQGGDPSGTGRGGKSIYGKAFEDEFSEQLFNFTGAVSMANAGPNTNGSQFFIVSNEHVPANMIEQMKAVGYPQEIIDHYAKVGGTPWLDNRHTVFGQVLAGMDVVKKISQVERDNMDKPKEDVVMEKVTIDNN